MDLIKLISTDFDGTLFSEGDDPPVAERLQALIGGLQARGAKWVINTGRDRPSLVAELDRAGLDIVPDYLILVEREIQPFRAPRDAGLEEWNQNCFRTHAELFARLRPDLPRLVAAIRQRFDAYIYADDYSPVCFVAADLAQAEGIHAFLDDYCRGIPGLTVVRNDIYARFSHAAFSKGTALGELTRRLGLSAAHVFAAGDQLNDLPMLSRRFARFLAAPANAIPLVQEAVRNQQGFVSHLPCGHGVADALACCLAKGKGDPMQLGSPTNLNQL